MCPLFFFDDFVEKRPHPAVVVFTPTSCFCLVGCDLFKAAAFAADLETKSNFQEAYRHPCLYSIQCMSVAVCRYTNVLDYIICHLSTPSPRTVSTTFLLAKSHSFVQSPLFFLLITYVPPLLHFPRPTGCRRDGVNDHCVHSAWSAVPQGAPRTARQAKSGGAPARRGAAHHPGGPCVHRAWRISGRPKIDWHFVGSVVFCCVSLCECCFVDCCERGMGSLPCQGF